MADYLKVEESIRTRITSGEWQPGSKIPTEKELQEEFGLCRATITKGLSGLVSDGIVVRHRGKGTFVAYPNSRVRGKLMIKSVSPSGKCLESTGVLEAMHDWLTPKGFNVGVGFYSNESEEVACLQRDELGSEAGFLVFLEPYQAVIDELRKLKEEGVPFVMLDAYVDQLDTDFVVTDNTLGARMMVEYLAGLGHSNIVYVTRSLDRTSVTDRLIGFVSGMIMQDLTMNPRVIKLCKHDDPNNEDVKPVIEQLLNEPNPPTAMFFYNDSLALDAMEHIKSKGIRVPEDISIVGYDDIGRAGLAYPPLTTVAQDFYAMGEEGVKILLERMAGIGSSRSARVFLKPNIVVRQSAARI